MNDKDELEQLKQLLFEKELVAISVLNQHVLSPQQRINDTADILADAITLASQDKLRLVKALNDAVDECIRSIVAEKPQQFADSLFPVMGPAIRKSITETLKSFVQSTNAMIEQSMSLKSLRWRWEAKRSGLPFSEVMFKHSLLYRVEEVFLIQQGSGLLIEHVSHPDVVVNDSDAISAMLTVIRDFSRDSFSAAGNDSLDTVEFGERTLWIIEGPKALLACVNNGMVPKVNRLQLQTVLEDFHTRYATEIEQFNGDRSVHPEFQALLATCLTQQTLKPKESGKKQAWLQTPFFWVFLWGVALSAYWGWQQYDKQYRLQALLAELKSVPGVVIIGTETQNDAIVIKGLQDPLIKPYDGLIQKHGFKPAELTLQMAAYQSLEPSIASQRAAKLLDAPKSVNFSTQGEVLMISGLASQNWLDFALKLKDRLPGLKTINVEQLQITDNARLMAIREQLQAPETVKLHLDQDILQVTGSAPADWIKQLKQKTALLQPTVSLNTYYQGQTLESDEWLEAQVLQAALDGRSYYFDVETRFNSDQQTRLQLDMAKVQQMLALLSKTPAIAKFTITAYTDNIGTDPINQALKIKRAETIKQALLTNGVDPRNIILLVGQSKPEQYLTHKLLRRADLSLKLQVPTCD